MNFPPSSVKSAVGKMFKNVRPAKTPKTMRICQTNATHMLINSRFSDGENGWENRKSEAINKNVSNFFPTRFLANFFRTQ